MKRKLDHKVLQDALYNLIEIDGVKPAEITNVSGVHNIQDTAEGANKPYRSTWLKLHKAYPKEIPPPTYKDGGVSNTIEGNVKGSAHQADTMTINNELPQDDNKLTPEELTLIRLIRTKEKPVELTIELIAQVATSK